MTNPPPCIVYNKLRLIQVLLFFASAALASDSFCLTFAEALSRGSERRAPAFSRYRFITSPPPPQVSFYNKLHPIQSLLFFASAAG